MKVTTSITGKDSIKERKGQCYYDPSHPHKINNQLLYFSPLLSYLSTSLQMGSERATNLALSTTFLLLLIGFASSDINQDKAECSDQLIGLANCLPYVAGQAKAPTIDCCTGLKMVIDKSKRCLCILIKDRDDPSLGLKINVSLALNLPTTCHTTTNLTQCVDLLHLAPKSPEAKVFEGFDKAIGKNNSSPIPSASNDGTGKGTSTSSQDKSGGGWGKSWEVTEVICGILPFVFISQFFFLV